VDEGEDGEVLAAPDVLAGGDRLADLADDDVARADGLAAVNLHATALRVGVATVARAACAFLVSHGLSLLPSARDAGDLERRERLPVPGLAAVVLPAPELEDDDLRGAVLGDDLRLDLGPAHEGSTDLHAVAAA